MTQSKYHQWVAEWLTGGRRRESDRPITMVELIDQFWIHAQEYYVTPAGEANKEQGHYKRLLTLLNKFYGHVNADEFGPLALKAIRQQMIAKGWCRRTVNHNVGRTKHIFRWAAGNELVPGSVYHALQAVEALQAGRSKARETGAVRPASQEPIDAVEPHVSRQVWAMIQLQLLTGARSGEIVIMRPCDIDRSGKVWLYTPQAHKTAWRGHERTIYIGPKAQQVLAPYLLRPEGEYCFSPAEAEARRRAEAHARRQTPMSCGNRPGTNRKKMPGRKPGGHFTPQSYARAITQSLKKAFPPPGELAKRDDETREQYRKRLTPAQREKISQWHKQHHWHPHQLRHNAATHLRKEFGLDAARIILGHRSPAVTTIYAEADLQKAIEVIAQVG
jgi:integrase